MLHALDPFAIDTSDIPAVEAIHGDCGIPSLGFSDATELEAWYASTSDRPTDELIDAMWTAEMERRDAAEAELRQWAKETVAAMLNPIIEKMDASEALAFVNALPSHLSVA